MTQQASAPETTRPGSAVQLRGIDYVEVYTGNAYQAAHFYRTVLGFTPTAYAGLETGSRDRTSFLVEQGDARFLLTSAHGPESAVAQHVHLHGEGVKDVAFAVDDAAEAFELAVARGARPVQEPVVLHGGEGERVVKSSIAVWGDTVHSFVERQGGRPGSMPGYEALRGRAPVPPVGFTDFDHIAVSMEEGGLDTWVDFYIEVLGFQQSHEEMVWTSASAMNSKVVEDPTGRIKLPIVEPVGAGGHSQIHEYLEYNHGAGTQHVALLTGDIVHAVSLVRENGADFLRIPAAYYDSLPGRLEGIDPGLVEEVRRAGVLVDRDDNGTLLQAFTRPLQTRPTFFLEAIERRGSRGFGGGNIRALFEAVEQEQARRGNL